MDPARSQRAAKRSKNRKREESKRQQITATAREKGKGRAINVNVDVDVVEPAATIEQQDIPTSAPATSSTKAVRLDPSLFVQAEQAFQKARENARLKKQQEKAEQAKLRQKNKSSKKRKSFGDDAQEGSVRLKQRIIGSASSIQVCIVRLTYLLTFPSRDTTIQELAALSQSQITIDPSTAMPSKAHTRFLDNRLFKKPKKAMLQTRSALDAKKRKKEEKPFLLFDPLLDKPKEDPKSKVKSRAANRMELEERMRGRREAKAAFSKSARRNQQGPSLGFATSLSMTKGRMHRASSRL